MPLNGTIRPRSQRYRPTPLKRDHQMSKSQTATDTIVGDDQRNTHSRRTVLRGLAATGSAAFAWNTISGSASAIEPSQQVRSDGPLSDPDSFETFLNGVLNAQLEAHDIPGATVAVVDGDSTFTKGYGVRDVRTDAPVEADDTLFRIGSTSKLFTWTAVMQGIEAGRLDLETDVNEYLDDITIPDTYDQPITLDHLVTHTAGFEERARGTFVLSEADLRPLSTMIRNERPARVRPPGAFTAYSNYGAARLPVTSPPRLPGRRSVSMSTQKSSSRWGWIGVRSTSPSPMLSMARFRRGTRPKTVGTAKATSSTSEWRQLDR